MDLSLADNITVATSKGRAVNAKNEVLENRREMGPEALANDVKRFDSIERWQQTDSARKTRDIHAIYYEGALEKLRAERLQGNYHPTQVIAGLSYKERPAQGANLHFPSQEPYEDTPSASNEQLRRSNEQMGTGFQTNPKLHEPHCLQHNDDGLDDRVESQSNSDGLTGLRKTLHQEEHRLRVFERKDDTVPPCRVSSLDIAATLERRIADHRIRDNPPFTHDRLPNWPEFVRAVRSVDSTEDLKRIEAEAFNKALRNPVVATTKPFDQSFKQRAIQRGRRRAAMQMALRKFATNKEQSYIGDQNYLRVVKLVPEQTVKPPGANLNILEAPRLPDSFQFSKVSNLLQQEDDTIHTLLNAEALADAAPAKKKVAGRLQMLLPLAEMVLRSEVYGQHYNAGYEMAKRWWETDEPRMLIESSKLKQLSDEDLQVFYQSDTVLYSFEANERMDIQRLVIRLGKEIVILLWTLGRSDQWWANKEMYDNSVDSQDIRENFEFSFPQFEGRYASINYYSKQLDTSERGLTHEDVRQLVAKKAVEEVSGNIPDYNKDLNILWSIPKSDRPSQSMKYFSIERVTIARDKAKCVAAGLNFARANKRKIDEVGTWPEPDPRKMMPGDVMKSRGSGNDNLARGVQEEKYEENESPSKRRKLSTSYHQKVGSSAR
jgi:hypothetical protein